MDLVAEIPSISCAGELLGEVLAIVVALLLAHQTSYHKLELQDTVVKIYCRLSLSLIDAAEKHRR